MNTETHPRDIYWMSILLIAVGMFFLSACAPIRPSPFAEKVLTPLKNSNAITIEQIQGQSQTFSENSRPLRMALIADSHSNYRDLDLTINQINQENVDFTVHLGDMTDLGLAIEYEAATNMLGRLQKPWLTVIGNHDAVGNGRNIYRRIFGSENQVFDSHGYRFIIFNNNQLEYLDTGLSWLWLRQQIASSQNPVILFQHANPFNTDNFSPDQIQEIQSILQLPKLRAVFHGHLHSFQQSYFHSVLIQQVGRTEGQSYAIVDLKPNEVAIKKCEGGSCEGRQFYFPDDTVAEPARSYR